MLHVFFGHYVTQCAENKTAALKYMFFGVEYGYGCSVHILLVRFEVIIIITSNRTKSTFIMINY